MCNKPVSDDTGHPHMDVVVMHMSYDSFVDYIYYCKECFFAIAPQNLIELLERHNARQNMTIPVSELFQSTPLLDEIAGVYCPKCNNDLIKEISYKSMKEAYKDYPHSKTWTCKSCFTKNEEVRVKYK
jgi:hypothetical protein